MQRAFPKVIADVVLSNDDDESAHLMGQNALIDLAVSTIDDARDAGKAPIEANITGPIKARASGTTRPTAAIWATTALASGARGRKYLCIAAKQSDSGCSVDQVMTQVELPPYHGPRNPLDMVA
jgi:hypothetical protein